MTASPNLGTAEDAVAATAHPEHKLRLVGSYGSNKVLAGELSRLVRRARNDVRVPVPERLGPGSVAYPFDRRMAEVAVRYHRTSARVLWQLMSSRSTRLEPLYADLRASMRTQPLNWLWQGASISVRAFAVQDFAAGERQIVGVVKNAIVEGAIERGVAIAVDPQRPDVWIDVRQLQGELFVSVDLAGRPMHQRGYRRSAGVAPLREDIAALMLMLSRYDSRSDVLIDPMGGAGTIAIEAACMSTGRGVWCSGYTPACATLPEFASDWPRQTPALFADTQPCLIYNDLDAEAEQTARENAVTAGVDGQLQMNIGEFRTVSRERVKEIAHHHERGMSNGLILSNPPYGHRLGHARELRALYRELGQWCRGFEGFRAGFLVDNDEFEAAFGLRPRLRKPLYNGPLRAVFYLYDL